MDAFAADIALISRMEVIPTILEVICRTTGMGFSAVARVTDSRWVACAVRDEIAFGLEPGGELPLATTLCDRVRGTGEVVVIDHVDEDAEFFGHPTPRMYGFQSYISMPIRRSDGRFFGTLCAIDPAPVRLKTPEKIGMFSLFANLISCHLDIQERLAASTSALADARRTQELREQFIAVLGHDLRSPVAAVAMGAAALRATPLDGERAPLVSLIEKSVERIESVIDAVIGFARCRLGAGFVVSPIAEAPIRSIVDDGVEEALATWPGREVSAVCDLRRAVACDPARVAQLLSNLLSNALAYGDPASPVHVRAVSDESGFALSVTNRGEPIPLEALAHIFEPFRRAKTLNCEGLGLGLFIANEIALAHGGSLAVTSTADETTFTFTTRSGSRAGLEAEGTRGRREGRPQRQSIARP